MLGAWWRKRKRRSLDEQPFPEAWRRSLETKFHAYLSLSTAQRERLETWVRYFISESHFEGAAGLTVTDEMRVIVSAYALWPLLELKEKAADPRGVRFYPTLETVLLYPKAFWAPVREISEDGYLETNRLEERAGEAWETGTLILAWDELEEGIRYPDQGYNVVIHECAHLLDQTDGLLNGTPKLPSQRRRERWRRVFEAEYRALQAEVDAGKEPYLDDYATEDPVEFFAVVSEEFFMEPVGLKAHHPALYQELADFFGQDPAGGSQKKRAGSREPAQKKKRTYKKKSASS